MSVPNSDMQPLCIPGKMKLASSARGALDPSGGWSTVDVGVVTVEVPNGKVQPFPVIL